MKKRTAALLLTLLAACCGALAETVVLDAPLYLQKDRRWRGVLLNPEGKGAKTIGEAGCTLSCLAMAETMRTGEEVTPDSLVGRIEMTGDELHWPKGYEVLARSQEGMLVRDAAPVLTACIESGRPALVCLYSGELGTHWVLVYGYEDMEPDDPQTLNFLIRDPGTKDRITFNMTKEWFPKIRVIRTYDPPESLRGAAGGEGDG